MPPSEHSERPARVEHLFVVRVWYEAGETALSPWRGSVEHAGSGARRYFTDYAALTAFIAGEAGPPPRASAGLDGSLSS
jgi:hypothetical protein